MGASPTIGLEDRFTEDSRRAKIVQMVMLVACWASAANAFMGLLGKSWVAVIISSIFAVICGLGAYRVQTGDNYRPWATLMCWATLLVITGSAAMLSSQRGQVLPWIICLPINAALMLGWRDAVRWVMAAALIAPASSLLSLWLPSFQSPLAGSMDISFMGAVLVAGGAVTFGEYCLRQAFDQLDESNHQLIQARDSAQAESESKSRFVANVSHEIRTPLNGVIGLLQILERRPMPGEQRSEVEQIRASAESLLDIINEVLDFSRIDAGASITLAPVPVDVRGIAQDIQQLLAPTARAKNVAIDVQIDDSVPNLVMADRTKLRQVLINLAHGHPTDKPIWGQTSLWV